MSLAHGFKLKIQWKLRPGSVHLSMAQRPEFFFLRCTFVKNSNRTAVLQGKFKAMLKMETSE
jgi:hypothetical protein